MSSIWTSNEAPVEVGGSTLDRMLAATAARFASRPALIRGATGGTVTYATLARRVERIAAGLAGRGFGPGQVLAMLAPNLPAWAGVALGAMAAGGTVTGVSPALTEHELTRQLTDARASVLVTIPSLLPEARRAAPAAGVRELIAIAEPAGQAEGRADAEAAGVASLASLLAEGEAALDGTRTAGPPGTVALLPYSSGTTGLPKPVMLTHSNLVTTVRQLQRRLRVTERDTILAVAPFFHVMGFVITLALPLLAGATVVTMGRFDLERFLALIQRHRVTVLVVPPPIMAALARHPMVDAYDLSSVELIASGGAPLGADLQREVAARLPSCTVGQGWGMTETTVGVAVLDRSRGSLPGSVGRLLPGTELRVVDPASGRDLGAGEQGELWVRGPQVMVGYRDRPDATAAILDGHGWLRTGDLGRVDADGNVFIAERLKELIKVNAYQVAPAELEALLVSHPGVADAAVIGRPDPDHGEVPVAIVVPRGDVEADELIAWVAERVAPHKRIRAVRFTDAVPRTPSGKLLRRVLVDLDRQTADRG
jgi:acyl-CoA synthetase (AMP-forming)/AMP-acid ligase II